MPVFGVPQDSIAALGVAHVCFTLSLYKKKKKKKIP